MYSGFYSPFYLTGPFRNTSLKVSTLPNSQRYRLLIGSGPACLWENCLICAHSSPGSSLECALWVSYTGFFLSFSSTRCLHLRAPGKVPLQKGGGHRWMDLITLTWSYFISFSWQRLKEISIQHTESFYFSLWLCKILILSSSFHIGCVFGDYSQQSNTPNPHVKWCLERNNGGTSGNSSACDHHNVIFD